MPYSFTQIERSKTKTIGFIFVVLVLFYFFSAWLIVFTVKCVHIARQDTFTCYSHETFGTSYTQQESCRRDFKYILSASKLDNLELFVIFFLAFIVGAFHWFLTVQNLVPKILKILLAEKPDPNDSYHQMFQNIVDEVSVATGGKKIDSVVMPTMAMNAFALEDFEGRAVIGVTEGLLSRLSRPQIEAVVGHEAAHLVTGDCLTTTVTSSLFKLYSSALSKLSDERLPSGQIRFGIWTVYFLLVFINFISYLLNMFISRQREFRADAIAVRLTRDPLSLAEALYTISRRWRGAGIPSEELEAIFIVNPTFSPLDEQEGFLADVFSTHPPVERRLEILLDMAHVDGKALIEKFNQKRQKQMVLEAAAMASRLSSQAVVNAGWNCPVCTVLLVKETYEGVVLSRCPQCRGIFISKNDIKKILIREDYEFSENIKMMAKHIKGEPYRWGKKEVDLKAHPLLFCPQCLRPKMVRMFFNDQYRVEIDKCFLCKFIWFEKDELEILQCLMEEELKSADKNFELDI